MSVQTFFHHEDARLTEGVTFSREFNTLYWIDIYRAEIHRLNNPLGDKTEQKYDWFNISTKNYDSTMFDVPYPKTETFFKESIGAIFLCGDVNSIYFGSKFGIGKLDFQTGKWCYKILYNQCSVLQENNRWTNLRSNDGNVSPDGKFIFIGLMNDFMFEPTDFKQGCILKISLVEKTIELVWDSIKIPNAIHWNSKNDKILVTDSLNHCIWQCSYNYETNEILMATKIKLIDTKANNPNFESPEPDGSDIDSINNLLYVSVWSTHSVQIYDTNNGNLIEKIQLPESTPRISCNCIVGDKLFITTANQNIDDESNANASVKDSNGGCIYKVQGVLLGNTSELKSSKIIIED